MSVEHLSPTKSALANIPPIGQILVSEGALTQTEVDSVLQDKTMQGFFGQKAEKLILNEDGTPKVTSKMIDAALSTGQTKFRATAAVEDMKVLVGGGTLDVTMQVWNNATKTKETKAKEPHWGNGSPESPVNPMIDNIAREGAASSAANMAELIVLLANLKPEIVKDTKVQEGVVAAKMLTMMLLDGDKPEHPVSKLGELQMKCAESLQEAAIANEIPKSITDDYIRNRLTEVAMGVDRVKAETLSKIHDAPHR